MRQAMTAYMHIMLAMLVSIDQSAKRMERDLSKKGRYAGKALE